MSLVLSPPRRIIATWSVRENRLLLDDVRVPTKHYMDSDVPESKQFRSAMKHLFGESTPQVATWFTGNLIIPTGEMVDYVHMGYGSTYSSYMVLTVIKGSIQKRLELSGRLMECGSEAAASGVWRFVTRAVGGGSG